MVFTPRTHVVPAARRGWWLRCPTAQTLDGDSGSTYCYRAHHQGEYYKKSHQRLFMTFLYIYT
jgi:hypothetical protein